MTHFVEEFLKLMGEQGAIFVLTSYSLFYDHLKVTLNYLDFCIDLSIDNTPTYCSLKTMFFILDVFNSRQPLLVVCEY